MALRGEEVRMSGEGILKTAIEGDKIGTCPRRSRKEEHTKEGAV